MAVLGRLLISSAERLDLPDLLSIDSYTAGDFKYLLKTLVNDEKPYIIKGFDVIDPNTAIGTQSCSIRIADSAVYYPGSSAGPFFHGLPEGNQNALPLVPELRKNAVNYVYLTFTTFNTSADSRAFWDPDKDGGAGGEFTQDVNTESVLGCQVNVSVGAFPANTIPIAKITVGPVVITAIEDARDMFFRLGTGGISPDPYAGYGWTALPSASYERDEPPTLMQAGGVNPFQGADKNILSLKEWMDAVMTKLRELGGTIHWYDDASTYSVVSTFVDCLTTTFKSKGLWAHDTTTPGLVTWTEDLNIQITSDPRSYILRAGNKTLANEQVAYLSLIRNAQINATDDVVAWTNGQPYVNTVGGSIGLFANLAKGDWIKRASDPNQLFLRVEEFYDSINASGSATTAANAKSIRLSGNYAGPTLSDRARYDKGIYQPSDVVASNRDQSAIAVAGGNFNWLFLRSDTIVNTSNIVTTSLTIDISNHDGSKARATSGAVHNLNTGDRITITGSTNFNGTYVVEVETSTIFTIQKSGGPFANETGKSAYYATVTTAARSTAYGVQLESANHGFTSNDTVIIAGTSNYNNAYPVSVVDATNFRIAVPSALATETSGTATLSRINARAEQGVFNLIQGESAVIGNDFSQNVMSFLGMTSESQTSPLYEQSAGVGAIYGSANYNSSASDNVTLRLSNLTAMMADRAQDKTVKYLGFGITTVQNTTNGANQEITFPIGSSLTVLQPGSPGNATIALPSSAPGIQLAANQLAYVTISRNAATTPTINISSVSGFVVSENTFVIATRLTTSVCWLWDGSALAVGNNPNLELLTSQDRNMHLIKGGIWSWDLGTTTLAWTADAFISIAGVTEVSNKILAGNSTALVADGDCLYVEVNRASGAATLTILSANIASVPNDFNGLIIARRVGNSIALGNGTILLIDGESKELDSGLSVQNRALIGAGVTEATSNPGYAARGAVNRITSDAEGALDAIARHDAEFDKYFGQFRMVAKTAGNKKRVRITGSDRITFTGETITQEMASLRVYFTGAEIDFATGIIYGGDATDPLSTNFTTVIGTNFTPETITSSEYLWYSIAANPSTSNADNSINVQFNVIAGLSSAATPDLANKPALGGLKHLGYVVVKDDGSGGSGTVLDFDDVGFTLPAASAQSKIAQLIANSSGGGAGLFKVTFFDPVTTTLPLGAVSLDSVVVQPNDLAVFSALPGLFNNKVYKAVGTPGNITNWLPQFVFNGSDIPLNADTIIVEKGNGFADCIGIFNGTTWEFNKKVRYFNGLDYWEQSALYTSATLNNNSTGTLFTVNFAGSQNLIVDYSILRGTSRKETGSLYVTTDGTNVSVVSSAADLSGPIGLTFSGAIVGATIEIYWTTDNSGNNSVVKYSIKRWSDTLGGPGGPPSYTGSILGPPTPGVLSVNSLSGAVNLFAGAGIGITVNSPMPGDITIASLISQGITSLNGLTATSQTFANDTNVTITSSGSIHTLGWLGQLSLTRGGTGANLTALNGGIIYSGASALAVSAAGTSGQLLTSSGAGAPSWTTLAGLNNGTGVGNVFASYSGGTFNFRNIKAGANVTVTQVSNDIVIDASSGVSNLDGGGAASVYGGIGPVDGGGA